MQRAAAYGRAAAGDQEDGAASPARGDHSRRGRPGGTTPESGPRPRTPPLAGHPSKSGGGAVASLLGPRATPPRTRRRAAAAAPRTPRPRHNIGCPERPPPHQPNTKMEAPPPPPPPAQKKKPPQSTQPETAEDGQTLFDDELDRLLPVGTVASVMRAAIPPEAKIGRDAREAAQDCASEFVAFVASEASDACAAAGRRIMTGRDVVDVRSRRPVV